MVKQASQAGADALRAVKTIVQKGDAKHWEPGQSHSINGESRFLGDSTLTVTVDYANKDGATVRYDWDRDMKYPAVERVKYSEIRYPTYGAVIDEKGQATPMSGIRMAANAREGGRESALLLLRAMDSPQSVSVIKDQKLGTQSLPAVVCSFRTGAISRYRLRAARSCEARIMRQRYVTGVPLVNPHESCLGPCDNIDSLDYG